MKKCTFTLFILCISTMLFAAPDFGADGLKGLTTAQKNDLAAGKIVFGTTDNSASGTEQKNALVQASIIFDKTPEETWALLSRTEDQIKYLPEIKELKIINKEQVRDNIEFKLRVAFVSVLYRVIHRFDKPSLYFYWGLDESFKNDLVALKGFWKFYPYGSGKTLARYGSNVSVKNVPSWIESMFKKSGVEKALTAVKKYVNSGGTYHK